MSAEGQAAVRTPPVQGDLAMVFAHLRLRVPEARSFLIAPPRSSTPVFEIARGLANLADQAGHAVALADVTGTSTRSTVPETSALKQVIATPTDLWDPVRLRQLLTGNGLVVAYGGGLLDHAGTLVTASTVDGVVIVARKGKTPRHDLEAARLEIERAGGRLVGAVLAR